MSRRRDRGAGPRAADRSAAAEPRPPAPGEAPRPRRSGPEPFLGQAAILAAVVGVVTLIAELAGAANLGVALGIAQIAFVLALLVLVLRY